MTNTPSHRAEIDLSNWRTRPYSAWSFQNAAELVPSATIRSARQPETPALDLGRLSDLVVADVAGKPRPLPDFLLESDTDNFVVMRGGNLVAEWHAPTSDPAKPHLVFSVSKSITGLLAGILIGQGMLSLDDRLAKHLPEAAGSAYGDATLRDLLNMQISIDFDEAYLSRDGAFDRYRRAMLWNPDKADDPAPDLKTFLCTLPKAAHPHGTRHAYRSPNVDMAAIILEQASGERFAELLSRLLWQPMGTHSDAQITVDRAGNPRASGGISMTARDLARVGELVRTGGGGIVPADWIASLWAGGDRAIWAAGDQGYAYPGGSYRNYWYDTGTGALAALGIHGQWLWIDPATQTVIVRQSSEPDPVNDRMDQTVVAVMKAVSAAS
ncbi:beta-lactamase family protein [Mesorhizobium mediterraneum]|uniref:Penicillin-binding protein n=1 Tax=Mesorhizobium mediterraneum TaxID=43617 RepID=A0AB36R0X9_9HYPH|nr:MULTISPECIES: serine hydrolase [Mesorhizobium]PAP98367.1 penicillin-binding protein [Mesorhizobium mediterraneum]RUU43362.1 class C beta-lactamase-related serine hydrolase [Mesorhizobium sp. M6A.T.Ce.TU.002.03.1.1]RUV02095.1 class C beta-lactamase-related serine hydrolase [Mesorhizobium sp. M6A.T.Cr.TU.017.01.1.1]RVB79148.1 class C beta-lactamase-related serine hydrolase [Mesorhizobium sp. M6A.T.Cr.TU.014.01.1.1]RWN43525.1 MAG: class C beta-lactamase-related serine hydrolase [Mesorhizobium 